MASETATQLPLDLSLYEESSDQDAVFCKSLLQALADGTKDAAEAAHDLDTWVTRESTRRLEELRSTSEVVDKTARENTPNASGYIERFFQAFPRLCAIFPPQHAGQTRVIAFLEALMAMPTHQTPDSFSDPAARDSHDVDNITLWPRGVIDPDTFRRYAAEIDCVGSGIEARDSEASQRWRNYQSALACITMNGFSDCSFLCGLRGILPTGKKYKLPTHKVQAGVRPADIGSRICGAVEWLVGADKARWVYQRCNEKAKTGESPRDTWSQENWSIWKQQLEFYQGDERVEESARQAARVAVDQMKAVEAEGRSGEEYSHT